MADGTEVVQPGVDVTPPPVVVDADNPPPTPVADPPEPTPPPATPTPPAKKPWFLGRIDELTAERNEFKAKYEEEQKKNAPPNPAVTPPATPEAKTYTREEVDQEVIRRANALAADQAKQQVLVGKFNNIMEQGKKEFPDFESSLMKFQQVGVLPPDMMEAVVDSGNGHAILRHLADDLEEVMRLKSLPAVPRAMEIARLSDNLKAGKVKVTQAPTPITPKVGGTRKVSEMALDDPELPVEEFIRRRNKAERDKKKGIS